MTWNNQTIVDLKREFLDTNGIKQTTNIHVNKVNEEETFFTKGNVLCETTSVKKKFEKALADLNICSQKGLVEKFDNTIGGKYCINAFWW